MSDPATLKKLKDKYDEIRRDEITLDMLDYQSLEQTHKMENGTGFFITKNELFDYFLLLFPSPAV